jgi:hypothetical protein
MTPDETFTGHLCLVAIEPGGNYTLIGANRHGALKAFAHDIPGLASSAIMPHGLSDSPAIRARYLWGSAATRHYAPARACDDFDTTTAGVCPQTPLRSYSAVMAVGKSRHGQRPSHTGPRGALPSLLFAV